MGVGTGEPHLSTPDVLYLVQKPYTGHYLCVQSLQCCIGNNSQADKGPFKDKCLENRASKPSHIFPHSFLCTCMYRPNKQVVNHEKMDLLCVDYGF